MDFVNQYTFAPQINNNATEFDAMHRQKISTFTRNQGSYESDVFQNESLLVNKQ